MFDNTRVADATTPYRSPSSAPAPSVSIEMRSRRPEPPSAPPDRRLYAVAIEVLHKASGEWRPEIRYTHAIDRPAAKFEVLRGFNWRTEFVRVVDVSIVIGYKVLDKQGLILAV
jgi:hypothetical protein